MKDGRQGQLVERCRRGGANELTEKLLQHPILSWVQAALSDEYHVSAKTLHSLALDETELVTRKKVALDITSKKYIPSLARRDFLIEGVVSFSSQSMLSLAKLAYLASSEPEDKLEYSLRKLDSDLTLIAHQEDVPVHVLEIYGYDVDKLRVLNPAELINVSSSILNRNNLTCEHYGVE